MYHIKAEKSSHGFYKIPETCVNAYHGNFEELLKYDDYAIVKSAVVNWFNDKHGNKDFSVGMNGRDSIILFSSDDWKEEYDYYFYNFCVMDDYLLYHENSWEYDTIRQEYTELKIVLQRKDKLNKIIEQL
jgi:hypothetical protein